MARWFQTEVLGHSIWVGTARKRVVMGRCEGNAGLCGGEGNKTMTKTVPALVSAGKLLNGALCRMEA